MKERDCARFERSGKLISFFKTFKRFPRSFILTKILPSIRSNSVVNFKPLSITTRFSNNFLESISRNEKKKSRRQEKGREIQKFANEYQCILSSARMRTGNKRVRIFLLSILIAIEIERLHASIDYKNTAISSLFKDILLFSVISLHAASHERCEEERWTLLPRDAGRRKPPTRAVLLVTRANTSFLSLPAMCDTQPQP